MPKTSRRTLLQGATATVVGATGLTLLDSSKTVVLARNLDPKITAEITREQAWAFFRGFYGAKDDADPASFNAHFAVSSNDVYQDATLGIQYNGYSEIAATFTAALNAAGTALGKGHLAKVFHVVGDLQYGAVAEYVFLKDTIYSTNGITVQTVFDLDGSLIVRDTDYWDSQELGESDIVGPAVTTDVAVPFGPVHLSGTPRSAPSPVPPGPVQLAVGVTGRPSASPEMQAFVSQFHNYLQYRSPDEIAQFFTEDAIYINPLLHQGPVLYPNFDQTIQIRGRYLIAQLFRATLDALPDCRASSLTHIVGGAPGGGFEWKAGGIYANTGLDRSGLVGCTALDLFEGRIQRMSVKFDTFQMGANYYNAIRAVLQQNGIIDQ